MTVNSFRMTAALLLLTSSLSHADQTDVLKHKPSSINLMPQTLFIPSGFDDNDRVQIVLSGHLPDSCYKAGDAKAEVNADKNEIHIKNSAYMYAGSLCAQVVTPYAHTLNLGVLPMGAYKIYVQDEQNNPVEKGTITIAASASPEPDDFLYAPVQDVILEDSSNSNEQPKLTLKGRFTSDCMHLQEVRVLYQNSQVIEVLPIAVMDTKADCKEAKIPFESSVQLQSPWTGNVLIYVRSLNGQSINKIVEL